MDFLAASAWNALLVKLRVQKTQKFGDLQIAAAVFVTWTIGGDLRGCIGTFEPGPIEPTVRRYAAIAALEDPRFRPISVHEVPSLAVAVTVLGELEPCGELDWVLGEHGIKAQFPGGYSATFLPEVPEEQGWSKQETLAQLAHKAGAASTQGIKTWRYPGHKFSLGYDEYRLYSS